MNRLANEKSPYLLQHKDNPVNWYPWGEEAFNAAKESNKPIFLSIGYSTCYWCHVMEKDSFEQQEVADVLNKHFISIKLDREERPDIDQIYMDAVVSMTGHGGWPMSVFLTPDLKPFWGATFFYKSQFISILEQLAKAWSERRNEVESSAQRLTGFLKDYMNFGGAGEIPQETISQVANLYEANYDPVYGGFGGAPKFPPAMQISFLLAEYHRTARQELLQIACGTLDAMINGGIFDQLGGGFHRYSVDRQWLVPHFEKMLYDNALLAGVYTEAYQCCGEKRYLETAKRVLDYLVTEMRSEQGGFYAAEDAGEVGREGEFYVWSRSELEAALSAEEMTALSAAYDLPEEGNFEHGKIILRRKDPAMLNEANSHLRSALEKLLNIRARRNRPHRDEKIITSWNALAISAFSAYYRASRETVYLNYAQKAADLILKEMLTGDELYHHTYLGSKGQGSGLLEDYSYLIEALLGLYCSDFNLRWLEAAGRLQTIQDLRFWDENLGGYFSSKADDIVVAKKEFTDNATPSGNSTAFSNLLELLEFSDKPEWRNKLESLAGLYAPLVSRYPSAFPKFMRAFQKVAVKSQQLVITVESSEQAETYLARLGRAYMPFTTILMRTESEPAGIPDILRGKGTLNGMPTFYLCEDRACLSPSNDFDEIAEKLAHPQSTVG